MKAWGSGPCRSRMGLLAYEPRGGGLGRSGGRGCVGTSGSDSLDYSADAPPVPGPAGGPVLTQTEEEAVEDEKECGRAPSTGH